MISLMIRVASMLFPRTLQFVRLTTLTRRFVGRNLRALLHCLSASSRAVLDVRHPLRRLRIQPFMATDIVVLQIRVTLRQTSASLVLQRPRVLRSIPNPLHTSLLDSLLRLIN